MEGEKMKDIECVPQLGGDDSWLECFELIHWIFGKVATPAIPRVDHRGWLRVQIQLSLLPDHLSIHWLCNKGVINKLGEPAVMKATTLVGYHIIIQTFGQSLKE